MALNQQFWKSQKNLTSPSTLVADCHCLPLKGSSKKVIIKRNRRKDICKIFLNRNKFKHLKPESVNFPGETNVFIHENLCLYYNKLWSKCKKLLGAGHISTFWVNKVLLRIKLSNISVSMITNDCDLEKLFPNNPLIEDNQLLIDFIIFCRVNKCSSLLLSLDVSFKASCFPPF